jgi:transcriptional regulator with XRE-family HTH domain
MFPVKYVDTTDSFKLSYPQARSLIANRIKDARLNSGLSQEDVAQKLHISQSSYSRMERGILAPDCAQIRVLSGLYGMSILWLLGFPNFVIDATQSSSSSSARISSS